MKPIILIVDDHDALRVSLRDWLTTEFPQCCVLEAGSAEEAQALARKTPPNIVVMDVSLPGMEGIEATWRMKHSLPGVKVVMLSIHEEAAYRSDAIVAGADAYVPKRKMQSELLPILTVLLRLIDHSHTSKTTGNGTRMKALIVEDEPLIRLTYEEYVESLGFDCTACMDATTALNAYRQTFYPLIVQDLEFPDVDGLEFCRHIRALPRGSQSIILVVSARDAPEDIRAAMEAGADDFLSKPVNSERFNGRIKLLAQQLEQRVALVERTTA